VSHYDQKTNERCRRCEDCRGWQKMREIVLGDETRGRDKGITILGKFEKVEG